MAVDSLAQRWRKGCPFVVLRCGSGPPPGTTRALAPKLISAAQTIFGTVKAACDNLSERGWLMSAFDPKRTFTRANVHYDTVLTARSLQVVLDEAQLFTRYFV